MLLKPIPRVKPSIRWLSVLTPLAFDRHEKCQHMADIGECQGVFLCQEVPKYSTVLFGVWVCVCEEDTARACGCSFYDVWVLC